MRERLSRKLTDGSARLINTPEWWNEQIEHALRIERQVDAWPKRRSEDPDTSYFEGDIETLRASQQAVLAVFDSTDEPLEDPEMIARYNAYLIGLDLPLQSESGLRTRRRELCRLGLLELVDRDGVSPTGRPASRYERTKT